MSKRAKGSGRTGGRKREVSKDASPQSSMPGTASKACVADATSSSKAASLKPRPILFRVLAVIVALWIALLLTIYFTTVLPARHAAPQAPSANNLIEP